MPGDLQWVSQIAVGQQWPQGDEDKLTDLRDVWYNTANQMSGFSDQLGPISYGMLDATSGPAGEQFHALVTQIGQMAPQMVDGAREVGDMAHNTAVQTQYSKLMILLQLIWMAEQIIEWSSTIWGLAVVPEVEAIGRLVVSQIARRFLTTVISATAIQIGMDALVQAFQMFVLHDRTKWDASATVGAAKMGALGGAVVVDSVTAAPIRLTDDDRELLASLLGAAAGDIPEPPGENLAPTPAYLFAPGPVPVLKELGARVGASLDLTFGPDTELLNDVSIGLLGAVDSAVIAEVEQAAGFSAGLPGAPVGLWRAWRYAGADDADPRPVYLVEVVPGGTPWVVTAAVQNVMSRLGEDAPSVEVFESWEPIGSYQAQARSNSALLWAPTPGRAFHSAQVYDRVDEATGAGGFNAGHPLIEGEAAALLYYLDAGVGLAITDAVLDDVIDPARRACVPLNLRTDGEWIWTDTVFYYLHQHGLSPDPRLVAHIKERHDPPPEMLDGVALFRAIHYLEHSPSAL